MQRLEFPCPDTQLAVDFGIVRAQRRTCRADLAGGLAETWNDVDEAHVAKFGVLNRYQTLPFGKVRIGENIRNVIDRRDSHLRLFQPRQHVIASMLPYPRADDFIERGDVLNTSGIDGEAWVAAQFGPANSVHQSLEDRLRAGGDRDPATITALIGIARGDVIAAIAHAPARNAELIVVQQRRFQQAQQRLTEREVNLLAAAAARVAPVERNHHGICAGNPRQTIGQWTVGQRWWATRLAGEMGEAGQRFRQRAKAGAGTIGAVLAEAGNAQHDKPGIDLVQRLIADAPAFQRAGAEVLDHYIRLSRQPLEKRSSLRLAEVEGNRAFVAAHRLPEETFAVLGCAPAALMIAHSRHFHLHHVGAKLGQISRSPGRGCHRGDIKYPNPASAIGVAVRRSVELPGLDMLERSEEGVREASAMLKSPFFVGWRLPERLRGLSCIIYYI